MNDAEEAGFTRARLPSSVARYHSCREEGVYRETR